MWSHGKDTVANRNVHILRHGRSAAKNDDHAGCAVQLDVRNRVGESVDLVWIDLSIGHQKPERALAQLRDATLSRADIRRRSSSS